MEHLFKHTSELSRKELEEIEDLFARVFEKSRPVETHLAQFVNNPLGYSYHSLIVDDGHIVGINSYVPVYYILNGRKLLFANSIDSMVDKPYRDFFAYKDMVDLAYREMRKEGVSFVYGYPNDNAYPVVIKSRLMKDIGKMRTYCLPLHVGGVKKRLAFLNPLSSLFCWAWVAVSGLLASRRAADFPVHKDEGTYNATRYRRGDGKYSTADLGDATLYYKIKNHEGVRTAFIIDITRKSPAGFVKAVKHIIRHHSGEFDLILYPGWLPFGITGMIRLPRRFEPKNFNFTGKVLGKEAIPKEIWDIRNWDTNLSNYDLI